MKGHKHLSEDERRIAVNLIRTADENEKKMETYAKVADIIGYHQKRFAISIIGTAIQDPTRLSQQKDENADTVSIKLKK